VLVVKSFDPSLKVLNGLDFHPLTSSEDKHFLEIADSESTGIILLRVTIPLASAGFRYFRAPTGFILIFFKVLSPARRI